MGGGELKIEHGTRVQDFDLSKYEVHVITVLTGRRALLIR